MLKKKKLKEIQLDKQPLGKRRNILASDIKQFSNIIEDIANCSIVDTISTLKPIQWRNFVVKLVCSTQGEQGETLRKLWVKMYKGDLVHGIGNIRRKAQENNWPIRRKTTGRRDRNSWIAFVLRNALLLKKEKPLLDIPLPSLT